MQTPRHSSSRDSRRGFSLLELLVVLAIVSVLSVLAMAGLGALTANRITTSALDLRSAVELARQRAITSGKPVELRVYKPNGSTGDYSAFRIVIIDGVNQIKLKMTQLADGIVIKKSNVGSTILADAPVTDEVAAGFIATETRCVRFLPNGSVEGLSTTAPHTLTIARALDPVVANELPANFATVSLDASLGTSAIYRP